MKDLIKRYILLILLTLAACTPAPAQSLPSTQASLPAPATSTPFQPIAIPPTSSPSSIITETPHPTGTPDLFQQYKISAMRARAYGGGAIEILSKLEENNAFSRYKIRYPSDGLTIYGFMNVPKGEGPFPVIIVIHGYSDPNNYQLMPYSTSAADDLSREGYLVIHPNMRGYGASGSGDSFYRAGLAVDILNLIALIKTQGLQSGVPAEADPTRIGIWAHSMGGEIALRVITVSNDVKATVLYAPMTGDIIKNAQILHNLTHLPEFQEELNTPVHLISEVSPAYHYQNITSPIMLYHGTADLIIPVEYSRITCQILTILGKKITCTFYEGAGHAFRSSYTADFEKSFYPFFQAHLLDP